ncbi:MAG: hypothetical protein WCH43_15920 [Verrucomicrobiota bacterium]
MPKLTVTRTSNVITVTDGTQTRMYNCNTVGAADKLEAKLRNDRKMSAKCLRHTDAVQLDLPLPLPSSLSDPQ